MNERKRVKDNPEYAVWRGMKYRCLAITCRQYKSYGGRGITVCARWKNSFQNFLTDMGRRPIGMTLERKDNNGNYEPSNCKWATRKEQQRNKRTNKNVTYLGIRMPIAAWAERLNLDVARVTFRIWYGWSIKRAFETPTAVRNRVVTIRGEKKTLVNWAKAYGISAKIIWQRIERGWSAVQAITTPIR